MMKIAILGGTFNPIHMGHIKMADYVCSHLDFDKVCFLPNGQPPHKKLEGIADKLHRLRMVELAIESDDRFFVSDYEISKDEYCYTVDTAKHFSKMDSNEYYFVIGADSLMSLDRWKSPHELKKICSFVVFDREGSPDLNDRIVRLIDEGCRIEKADMPFVDISSTDIRNMIRDGRDISDVVPEKVAEYILKNGLYR